MAVYSYKGRRVKGDIVNGTLEGDSQSEIVLALKRQGIFPINITNLSGRKSLLEHDMFKKKVSTKELSIFCKQFHTIIMAGISLLECLDILKTQVDNPTLKATLDDIYIDVQKGINLSSSMKKHPKVFPEMLVNMVASGELSGKLDLIMKRMSDHYQKEYLLQVKIKKAMVYPIILITAAILTCFILLTVVLPSYVSLFESFNVDLPGPTKVLLAIGAFLNKMWWLLAVVIGGAIYSLKKSIDTLNGRLKYDKFKLNAPIFGRVTRKIVTARFARSLATMINSGVSIIDSINMVIKVVGNRKMSKDLLVVNEKLKQGEGLSGPLSEISAFPPMLVSMIKIGEESGAIDEMLESTADFYDEEVEYAIEKMISLINPIILLIMTIVVGLIVMSVALPMFQMFSVIEF